MIRALLASLLLASTACASPSLRSSEPTTATLSASELAFSRAMQDRDFEAFSSFIADDAVFINGGKPLRGKAEILDHWRAFFASPSAPFSWRPEISEIVRSERLGYTEGPVTAPDGAVIATFYSVWKMQADGRWAVVFDNGYEICDCRK
jgi:ketosteroid isomerase-like protein